MEKAEKFWDKQADNFDPADGDYGETFRQSVSLTQKHLNEDDVVLDFACGTGRMSIALADQVQMIDAIDISSKMIAAARKKAKQQDVTNVSFAHATLFAEQLQPNTFDVVMAFNILHLLEDVPNAVQRVNDLLKPNGRFISASACLGGKGLMPLVFSLISKLGFVPSINKFTSSQLENMIVDNRFSDYGNGRSLTITHRIFCSCPETVMMKAIVWTKYGGPDVLQLQDVPKPVPQDDEIHGQNPCHHGHGWRLRSPQSAISALVIHADASLCWCEKAEKGYDFGSRTRRRS